MAKLFGLHKKIIAIFFEKISLKIILNSNLNFYQICNDYKKIKFFNLLYFIKLL